MKVVRITRLPPGPFATFGMLEVEGTSFRCVTLERPWLQNKPNVSSIPEGTYRLELGTYHAGGYPAYELQAVPNRTLIKIHAANIPVELEGCIALGSCISDWSDGGGACIINSRNTLRDFMVYMGGELEAALVIGHG